MKSLPLVLAACAFIATTFSTRAAETDPITPLPFPVSIGGQAATVKPDSTTNHADIDKPVAANAPLEVGSTSGMIIVNIATANDQGIPAEGATPAIIVIQGGNKTTLDKTMDGKKLAAGNYLMAVVADGKTASVFFKVQ
jgi:hypothetical protein